ncbi:MAG: ABC transporter permease [Chloroflexi bacterium]|nr:ABC transporter permease [Chloroflexota bacterium]
MSEKRKTLWLNRLGSVIRRELIEMTRDKLYIALSIISPFFLFFLFAYGFPLDVKDIPMGVYDMDGSMESRNYIELFSNSVTFKMKYHYSSRKEMLDSLSTGYARASLVIPPGFGRRIAKGENVTVQLLIDAASPNRAIIISNYAEAMTAVDNMKRVVRYMKEKGMTSAFTGGIQVYVNAWFNPTLRSDDYMLPGIIAIVLIFFPPLLSTVSISREKESGAILSIYCSPITRTEYIVGKLIPYTVVTYIESIIFLILTRFMFGVPIRGSLVLVLILLFLYTAGVIAIGILIGTLMKRQVTAILITTVGTLLPSFLYSGFMVPLQSMGAEAQRIGACLPVTYAIDGLRKLMIKGVGLEDILLNMVVLAFAVLLLTGLSIFFFQKRIR